MTKDEFEQLLNDCYPTVQLFGMTFGAGQAIRELDPIAFDVMYQQQLNVIEPN